MRADCLNSPYLFKTQISTTQIPGGVKEDTLNFNYLKYILLRYHIVMDVLVQGRVGFK